MSEITIEIKGLSNAGKSQIAFLIKNMLKGMKFKTSFENSEDLTEEEFDKKMGVSSDNNIQYLKNLNTEIKVVV